MISERIRTIRDHFDMTRKEFGERIYVSQDVINNLERGRVVPTEHHIKGICEKYNVNEHWLRTGDGEMFNPAKDSSLDALAEAHQLDNLTRAIIEALIEMNPAHREAFTQLVSITAAKIRSADYDSAQPEAIAAAINSWSTFNAAKAKNPPAEDHHDLQEPHTK